MTTIVSITPISVEADSRTFKQAASVARFGYRSIVVEGEPSKLDKSDLPFELLSIRTRRLKEPVGGEASLRSSTRPLPRKLRANLSGFLQRLRASRIGSPLRIARFLAEYMYRYLLLPTINAPAASVYYLHAPHQFPAVYLLCKRHRARFVYDAHDFYSGLKDSGEMTNATERLMNGFVRCVESLCIKNAAVVVTVNDGLAALLRESFGCSATVIRNTHDARLDKKAAQTLRQKLGLKSDAFLLVSVGHAKEGRAVREALIAMADLPESIHLAFLGRNYAQFQEAIDQLGLQDRVHLAPPVKPTEVVPFIEGADAALILYYPKSIAYLPSLPNGFFQAIAAELPLLYPELPEIKRLAEQYHLGIPINPLEPDSIRAGVLALSKRSELIPNYRKNLQRAKQELTWEREEKILREMLCGVLS